jgi:diguanylate cyclase (GGDEF)-like protein
MAEEQPAGMTGRLRALVAGLDGPTRVWLLNGFIATAAVLLTLAARNLPGIDGPVTLPWWAIAPMVYVAELAVVHLRFRRDAHSLSMSEIPLVIGLFFASPLSLIVGQFVGNFLGLALGRRQPLIKLVFNLSQFSLVTVIGVLIFHQIVSLGKPLGPAGFAAAVAASLAGLLLAHLLINSAIRISGGRMDRVEILDVLALGAMAAVINTSLALVGITVLWRAPEAAWLAFVPPIVLFLAYRAYISQREERARLESLYQAMRALHESPQIEAALLAAADQAKAMFDAEFVEITVLHRGDEHQAYTTVVGPGDRRLVMEPVEIAKPNELWTHVMETGDSKLLVHKREPGQPRAKLSDAIAAPLTGDQDTLGVIVVGNRLGDISSFTRQDLKLLITMASQISVSLENGRLEDSLAQLTVLKEELRHQALHDSLTKLANRTLFTDHVEQALNRLSRDDHSVAVLFLDLDDFKTVNDSLGHAAGDELLVTVAHRLRSACRPGDSVARLGGDEFAILLERIGYPGEAIDVAERIITRLGEPVFIDTQELKTRVSIGIAFGSYGNEPAQLLRNADAAMYAAKKRGKGHCRVFEAGMHTEMIRRLELQSDLQRAIERGELSVEYQPIVLLASGEITGFEALVRWDHPSRGETLPSAFVPFAEETGLIVELGGWVLREACRQAGRWEHTTSRGALTVSVNLSPRQLMAPNLVAEIAKALDEFNVDAARLVLEITENVLMKEGVHETLEELKTLGVGLAIDDFGTGYSSLSYLDRLPVDIIKVDKSFVERLGDEDESPLVRTVLGLGESLGLRTIVEGIETAEQFDRLKELGCQMGQGFFLAEPLTVDALDTLFSGGPREEGGTGRHLRAVG